MTKPCAKILDWRPLRKNALLGFARVQFGSGLIVNEVAIHQTGSRAWASPPSCPWIRNNTIVFDETSGKPKRQPILDFANHGVRSSWSRQVLAALREAHPEALTDAREAP